MNKDSFSKSCVILMFFSVFLFTALMIIIFCVKNAVPDQLVLCFFAFWGVEGGALAWIKRIKVQTKSKTAKKSSEKENVHDNNC